MFQYPTDDEPISLERLTLLSQNDTLYMRDLDPKWIEDPKTFSFVHVRHVRDQKAVMIVQSKTFSISPRLGDDLYVLCTYDIEYRIFILLFPDKTNADNFETAVKDDLEPDVPCSSEWLTFELLQKINSR